MASIEWRRTMADTPTARALVYVAVAPLVGMVLAAVLAMVVLLPRLVDSPVTLALVVLLALVGLAFLGGAGALFFSGLLPRSISTIYTAFLGVFGLVFLVVAYNEC
ncbi:MAG: hypothetical protein ABEH35_03710 [Haloarculaceae archaeon]